MSAVQKVVPIVPLKTCSKCKVEKPVSMFRQKMGRNHDSIARKCEDCFSEMRKATWAKTREEKQKNYVAPTEKNCGLCGFEKPIADFNTSRSHADGFRPECKMCQKTRNKTWRMKHNQTPEMRAAYLAKKKKYNTSIAYYDKYFMKKFGVTYAEVRAMYENQFGRCANRACGKDIIFYHENENGRANPNRACLDHDHETGKVRALLCMPCNTILGTLETKENILLGLMEYKAEFKRKNLE